MNRKCGLNALNIGDCAKVLHLENSGSIRRRLQDIGVVEGTKIRCVLKAPGGDPTAFLIKGAVIAIREDDSKKIFVRCGYE
ncbi:MAG: ferrous iron transport protein A [Clostridia bacterium]|nr:ferrous iron transport protein A [Clostridia bacterium]